MMKIMISSFFTFLLIHIVWFSCKRSHSKMLECNQHITKNVINIIIFAAKIVIEIVNMPDKFDIWYDVSQ